MPNPDQTAPIVSMQLQAIELLKGSIHQPPANGMPFDNYSFTVNVEHRPDPDKQLVFVIVTIDIKGGPQNSILGSLSASCIYLIENFKEIFMPTEHGQLIVPAGLSQILTSISVSTVRGIMFATFKGTYLHNAVLPIVDPTGFHMAPQPAEKTESKSPIG